MQTLLQKRTGAPGDYTSVAVEHLTPTGHIDLATPAMGKEAGLLTPAEFPRNEDERMTFIHQYPAATLEDDVEDEDDMDEDVDDLDDEDIDDSDLDDDDMDDVADDDLDDEDLDLDDDEEDDEDEVI